MPEPQPKDKNNQLTVPTITCHIIRQGDKLVFEVKGRKKFVLPAINDFRQTYNLTLLDSWITQEVSEIMVDRIREAKAREKAIEEVRQAFTSGAEEANEQEMINKLLDQGTKQ